MTLSKEEKERREELFQCGIKVCCTCKKELPLEFFNKNKRCKDGFAAMCRDCAKQKLKVHYQENREKMKRRSREWKDEHPEYAREYRVNHIDYFTDYNKKYREEHQEYFEQYHAEHDKQYYENNRDQRLAYQKQYREEHPELVAERRRRYYQEHRDEILAKHRLYRETHREQRKQWLQSETGRASDRASRHKRRMLIAKNGGAFTKEEVCDALAFFDYKCAYTGEQLEDSYHLDHVVALTCGGTNYIWNIVPCNQTPNLSKNNSDMEEWYRKQSYFSEERLQKIYDWIILQKSIKGEEQ